MTLSKVIPEFLHGNGRPIGIRIISGQYAYPEMMNITRQNDTHLLITTTETTVNASNGIFGALFFGIIELSG